MGKETYSGCGDIAYLEVGSCNHQWFEIKKLNTTECNWGCIGGSDFHSHDGVLVACANCELKKEIWE